ncbi:MAG: hypothetical protein WCG55_04570 [bacterium]
MENKLWFRAKRFGWGWYPVTWQGWGVILLYVFAIFAGGNYVNNHESSGSDFVQQFVPQLIVLTIFLIIICYKTGEKPAWRWGGKDVSKN